MPKKIFNARIGKKLSLNEANIRIPYEKISFAVLPPRLASLLYNEAAMAE